MGNQNADQLLNRVDAIPLLVDLLLFEHIGSRLDAALSVRWVRVLILVDHRRLWRVRAAWRFFAPAHGSSPPAVGSFSSRGWDDIMICIVFHVDEHLLNDELMLLITLSWLVAFLVCPTNLSLAAFARNVADTVKPSH